MDWILVLTRRFIPNNTNKFVMKYQNTNSKNPLQLHVMHDPWFFEKYIINKQFIILQLYLYINQYWRDTPIHIILNIEEPAGDILSASHVIRQGSEI